MAAWVLVGSAAGGTVGDAGVGKEADRGEAKTDRSVRLRGAILCLQFRGESR